METEKCEKCGVEVEKGTLIRDQNGDASQLRCNVCIAPDPKPKKTRKPRKRKEKTMIKALEVPASLAKTPLLEIPPIPPGVLERDAELWAKECGLKDQVRVNPAVREDYPRHGFGYTLMIQEQAGKRRMGTARYNSKGERSYWSVDGIVTG